MCLFRLEGGEAIEMHCTIAAWTERLPAELFVRASRGLLINRSLVTGIAAIDRNSSQVFLDGCPQPLVISRLETSRLRKSLSGTLRADRHRLRLPHRTGRLRPRAARSCHRSTRIVTTVATTICAESAAYGIQSAGS